MSDSDGPDRSRRARRRKAGGAAIATLVVICLAGGCGSGGKHSTSAISPTATAPQPDRGSTVSATSTVGSGAGRATTTRFDRSSTTASTRASHRPRHQRTNAVFAVTRAVKAHQRSALAGAEKSCSSQAELQNASLYCQMLAASAHNKALARLLGVGAPSH
jgi:hypothetical protein